MSAVSLARVLLGGLAAVLVIGLTGCDGDLLQPPPDELQLYVLLSLPAEGDSTVSQPAYLLRQPEALKLEYVAADAFHMRRVADGRSFAWRHVDVSGSPTDPVTGVTLRQANYSLPYQAKDGLGVQDLAPGGRYRIQVRVDGRVIEGTTRIPGRIEPSVEHRPDGRYLVWPRTEGAAGYRLRVIHGVTGGTLLREFTTDTSFRLSPGPQEVRVEAFDANAFRYLAEDPQVISAGIDGASGLFGSVARARLRLDE